MTQPTAPAPVDPALVDRVARALLTVQLHIGPNAIATAQSGRPIRLSGGEADRGAAAVLAELAPELAQLADHEIHHHHALADAVGRPISTPWPDLITAAFRAYRDADLLSEAERERQTAEAALTRVRELHHRAECVNVRCKVGGWCIGCDPEGLDDCAEHPWPCPTIRALDAALTGPAEENQP